MNWKKVDGKEFNRQISFSTRLEFLTRYDDRTLDQWELYVAIGGGVGFALTPEHELVNLFNITGVKLCGREAVDYAISKGADNLFCFDGFLRKYYEHFGFRKIKSAPWNEDLAPTCWNYDKYGTPRVVWMELNPRIAV